MPYFQVDALEVYKLSSVPKRSCQKQVRHLEKFYPNEMEESQTFFIQKLNQYESLVSIDGMPISFMESPDKGEAGNMCLRDMEEI